MHLGARAEKRAEVFWEQKLVIFPFLKFFIETLYIPAIVGLYELSVLNDGALQYYAIGTRWEISINGAIFTKHMV